MIQVEYLVPLELCQIRCRRFGDWYICMWVDNASNKQKEKPRDQHERLPEHRKTVELIVDLQYKNDNNSIPNQFQKGNKYCTLSNRVIIFRVPSFCLYPMVLYLIIQWKQVIRKLTKKSHYKYIGSENQFNKATSSQWNLWILISLVKKNYENITLESMTFTKLKMHTVFLVATMLALLALLKM